MTDLATEPQRPQRRQSSRRDKMSRKAKSGSVSSRKTQALRLTPVKKADAGMIHDAVLKILWEIGVIVDHHPSQKMLVEEFGCREGSDGYVRMPPDLVEQAISTVPKKITLYDLNGNVRVDTSTKIPSYCPGHNCVRIVDHRTRELRPCRLEDIKNTAVLCERLHANIDMVCSLGYPSDIPAEDEAVETVRAMVENSIKPAAILAHDDVIQGRILEFLAEVAGGWNNLADKPIALELMGPISPLKLPDDFCLRIINCARSALRPAPGDLVIPRPFPASSWNQISIAVAGGADRAVVRRGGSPGSCSARSRSQPGLAPVLSGSRREFALTHGP